MTARTVTCEMCGKEFATKKAKLCPDCSAKRKREWDRTRQAGRREDARAERKAIQKDKPCKPTVGIVEASVMAKEAGMSYGKCVAMMKLRG